MKQTIAALLACTITLTACSTASKNISANYVSPVQYQAYDCEQLTDEAQRLQVRVSQLGGRLDEAAANDKAIMGVGLVLFWPALFALGGTKEQEAEYARLTGEYDAIQKASVLKKCPATLTPTPLQNQPEAQAAEVPQLHHQAMNPAD